MEDPSQTLVENKQGNNMRPIDGLNSFVNGGGAFKMAFIYLFWRVFVWMIIPMLFIPFIVMLQILMGIGHYIFPDHMGIVGQIVGLLYFAVPVISYWWFWISRLAGE